MQYILVKTTRSFRKWYVTEVTSCHRITIVNPQNTHLLVNEWNVPDVTTLCRTWSCNQNTQSLVCLRKRIVRGLTSVTREIWSCRHRNLKTLSNSENGLSPNHKQINIRYLPIIWNNTMISLLTRLNGCENKFFYSFFSTMHAALYTNKLSIKTL